MPATAAAAVSLEQARVAVDDRDAHLRHAGADQADLRGRGAADVDHPAADEGAAVVDADDDGLAVAEILDLDAGAEGQRAMGGREAAAVGGLAARRAAAEIVPGGLAALAAGHSFAGRRQTEGCRQTKHERRNADPTRHHVMLLPVSAHHRRFLAGREARATARFGRNAATMGPPSRLAAWPALRALRRGCGER